MRQLESVELFVCSEDATQPIGFADKVEVWTEGGGTTLILRGINGYRKDLLQAENECLRRDVEFYKKLWQARGGTTTPVEQQPEVNERGPTNAKQRQMTKYTADEFANARFAKHPDGGAGSHRRHDGWVLGSEARHSDADMARAGWVPVLTKPTITESQCRDLYRESQRGPAFFGLELVNVGIEIIPDPEPTNTERLEQLIRESGLTISNNGIEGYAAELAASLNEDGVTAPEDNA